MIDRVQNTPPSSINGDEIMAMDDDEIIFEEMEELDFADEMYEEVDEESEDQEVEKSEHLAVVFEKHKGPVFCCDLHPTGTLAATGGEDETAYVWSTEDGRCIMTCTGYKDSVFSVGFSFDGAYLATLDLAGIIKVWKCRLDNNQQEPWPIAFEYETDDLHWANWHFGSRVLICGAATGDVYVFKIPSGETKVLRGHSIQTQYGKLFHDGVRLAAGYNDGSVKIFDLKSGAVLQHIPPSGSQTTIINGIDVHPENNLLAYIKPTEGKIVLLTPNNGKVVAELESEGELETVVFSPDPQMGYFASGTLTGSLIIWDTGRKMIRHHCAKSSDRDAAGITKIIWIKDHIVTSCLDGSIRCYDSRSGERKLVLETRSTNHALDMCYNATKNIILTASEDKRGRIYNYAL